MINPSASISIFVEKYIIKNPVKVSNIENIKEVFRPIDSVKQERIESPIVPPKNVKDWIFET